MRLLSHCLARSHCGQLPCWADKGALVAVSLVMVRVVATAIGSSASGRRLLSSSLC